MTADWAMVIITTIYVVATILICWANIKSAQASKEQLKEMQKQYEESNRPNIAVEFLYEKRTYYGIRFINYGKMIAKNVKINLSKEFIYSLEDRMQSILMAEEGKHCFIGVNQHYDLYFGTPEYKDIEHKVPASGTITYFSNNKKYEEKFSLDIENYMTTFSVNTDFEDLLECIKKQNTILKDIKTSVDLVSKNIKINKDQNVESREI